MENAKQEEVENVENWSEAAEDLVTAGDTVGAISLLETIVSNLQLQTLNSSDPRVLLQLASVLTDLSDLYSSTGFSLKADDLCSRASTLKHQAELSRFSNVEVAKEEDRVSASDDSLLGNHGHVEKPTKSPDHQKQDNESSDDDWEAIADLAPDKLLSTQCLPGVSELSLENVKVQTHKQRGRGTFSYQKHELYSDHLSGKSIVDDAEDKADKDACHNSEGTTDTRNSRYCTQHVLVLADFPPSTRTIELEKLFEDFRDRGFVIRWVNDTTALAVFRTPSTAVEARNHIRCPFTVRILDEDDTLLSSISPRDLEPPKQRPRTSARTAQRLIAQELGLKLPSTGLGSRDFRKQEDARRNRIVTRQKLRDDAWGDDVN